MAKVRNLPPSGNAKNEAMQAWNMQFPTSAGGTFGGIKIPPQGNPNAAIDTITLRGIHGEIKNLNMGLALSFESLNQGIQSLVELQEKSIIADKKEDSDEARARANADAENIENERESRLGKLGGSLKEGASAVKTQVQKVASGFSISGFLSTLIGGALLAAVFAPEVYKKLENQIKSAAAVVMDDEFVKKVVDTGFEIFKKNFEVDNLLISAIFGFRAGALYSAGEYFGEKIGAWGVDFFNKMIRGLADSLGMETEEVLYDLDGEAYTKKTNFISEETKQSIIDNMGTIFAVGSLAAVLMPGLFIGIGKMMGAVGLWIGRKIFATMFAGDAIDLADEVIPDADQRRLRRSGRQLRGRMRRGFGRLMRVAGRAFGIIGAIVLAVEVGKTLWDSISNTEVLAKTISLNKTAITSKVAAGTSKEKKKELEDALEGMTLAQARDDKFVKQLIKDYKIESKPGTEQGATPSFMRGLERMVLSRNKLSELAEAARHDDASKMSSTARADEIAELKENISMEKDNIERYDETLKDKLLPPKSRTHMIGLRKTSLANIEKYETRLAGLQEASKDAGDRMEGPDKSAASPAQPPVKHNDETPPRPGAGGPILSAAAKSIGAGLPPKPSAKATMARQNLNNDNVMGDTLETPEGVAKYTTAANKNEDADKATMARQNLNNDNVMGDTLETPEGVAKYTNKSVVNANKRAAMSIMNPGADTLEKAADIAIEQAPKWYDFITKALTPNSIYVHDTHVEAQLKKIENPTAALVGEASASQSSAAMNVIMMGGMGGGPQTAAAASGATVNNNIVKSDSNISLYSMNEENRAAYAHLTRFGALG